MTTKYYFDLGALTAVPTGLTELVNYREAIAGSAACVGVWFFETANATMLNGNATALINWKAGGVPLEQATVAQQAAIVTDTSLGSREVGIFTIASATRYLATGFTFAPNGPWTIVAVVKPLYTVAGELIAGANTSTLATAGGLYTWLTLAPAPVFRSHVGATQVQSAVQTADTWVRAFASHPGVAAGHTPKIKVGAAATIVGAASADNPATIGFSVGQQFQAYGGRIASLMLFNVDLLHVDNAVLLATVQKYLDLRYGNLI